MRKTAGNAVLRGSAIVPFLAWILVTERWFPDHGPHMEIFDGAGRIFWGPLELVGWLMLLAGIYWLVQNVRTWIDPIHHPAIARLARHGGVADQLGKLSIELDGAVEQHGTATFTSGHLLVETWSSYAIVPIDRIVWCYEVETDDQKFGIIPNGRIFRVYLAVRGGETFVFASSVRDHESVMRCIAARPGNRVFGFDEGIAHSWDADPVAFARGIDLLASEGRLHEEPAVVIDAARRAALLPESDLPAEISRTPGMLDWIRNAFDRPGR